MVHKMKTHKGTSKRVKVSGSKHAKKFLHKKAGKRHLLVKKWNNLDSFPYGKSIHESDYKTIKTLLPYS